MNKKTGLTLMEILVSTVIMALVMFGLANLFIAGKKHIFHARSRATVGELGRYFLDPLQMQVKEETWSSSCLKTGSCPTESIGTKEGLDRDYKAEYTVTPDSPITNLTKVSVNITWTEE